MNKKAKVPTKVIYVRSYIRQRNGQRQAVRRHVRQRRRAQLTLAF